jgi:hypothetical protein
MASGAVALSVTGARRPQKGSARTIEDAGFRLSLSCVSLEGAAHKQWELIF